MGNIFEIIFVNPVVNLLVVFYKLFLQVGLPGAFGFAIIAITLSIRGLLHPFFQQQIDTAHKMKGIKPKIDELSKKHKNDAKKLQQEQMRLYQEAGINPAAGCLFAIVQIPVFIGLYQTLQLFLVHGSENGVVKQINQKLYDSMLHIQSIDPNFFMFNLALSPAKAGEWYYYLIPVMTAALQYWQTQVTMPAMTSEPAKTDKKDGSKKEEKSNTSEEFQKALQMQMKYFFPIMIGYFSYTLPVGLSIYWNIFSLFSIIQHYLNARKTISNLQK
ncbi:MAG: YidC/Oxa1 family membrane protein insertase [Weeksellaceae bacterium]